MIEAGLRNISRHNDAGAADLAATEIEHIKAVTKILTAWLLRDSRQDPSLIDLRYWKQAYPQYLAKADPESRKEYLIAWEFLAFATLGSDYRDAFAKGETPEIV